MIAALLLCAAELRAVARTAMASQGVVVVEGQRRVGIVSEMLPGCRLGVCMRVGAAFLLLGEHTQRERVWERDAGVGESKLK